VGLVDNGRSGDVFAGIQRDCADAAESGKVHFNDDGGRCGAAEVGKTVDGIDSRRLHRSGAKVFTANEGHRADAGEVAQVDFDDASGVGGSGKIGKPVGRIDDGCAEVIFA